MKKSFYIALLVAFVDFMGLGLIYPLFSSMLFHHSFSFVPAHTTAEMRGFWLGILLALMPLAQFFSAPIWGAVSDNKGRKKPLVLSLVFVFAGYSVAALAVFLNSLGLLLASRLIIGLGAGNMSIVQATIADLSTPEEKTKNFALYSMALGVGFTLGPFFGGSLAHWGPIIPFTFSMSVVALNLILAFFLFQETHLVKKKTPITLISGFVQIKRAFLLKGVKTVLLCSFLHNFGWSYFFEFAPVYLLAQFDFSPQQIGLFFAAGGCYYALSAGLLIRSLLALIKPLILFSGGMFFTALCIFTLPLLPSSLWIWPLMFFLCYFVAFVTPTSTTIVSNSADAQAQGESLGVLSSINSAALILSPLISGSLVGIRPSLPMWVGGSLLLISSMIMLIVFRTDFSKNFYLK